LLAAGVGQRLHALPAWRGDARAFHQVFGRPGGEIGPDNDIAARGIENLRAWILGRNMFGPVRGG
jgi:hypothetical protein